MPPRLYVTADDDEFDSTLLQHFEEEGFHTTYLPLGKDGKAYRESLRHLADDLELGENYAIIGAPRAIRIDNPTIRLTALQLSAKQQHTASKPTHDHSPISLP